MSINHVSHLQQVSRNACEAPPLLITQQQVQIKSSGGSEYA